MEYQIRGIVVFVDWAFDTDIVIAVTAKVFTVVFIDVFIADERAAAVTAGVVTIPAVTAQDTAIIPFVVIRVNTPPTFVAEEGKLCRTVRAEEVSGHLKQLIRRILRTAMITSIQLRFHSAAPFHCVGSAITSLPTRRNASGSRKSSV